MALPPRLTTAAQEQLSRVKGQGEELLSSASSQARQYLEQAKGKANSAISVLKAGENFSTAASGIKDAATQAFKEAIPTGVADAIDFDAAIGDLRSGLLNVNSVVGQTENQLKAFASYNYVVTLACLTVNEINFPDATYRARPPQVTVLRSGGGAPGKALTAYESEDAQLEYFIDEIEIDCLITPTTKTRTSNATTGSFTVHEPYSMGLFLQTLMIAANKAGHADYLKAPYALIFEFKGYDDNGNALDLTSTTRRVFPIKLNKVDFDVNSGGSTYRVNCHAWNEGALSNTAQHMRNDISITGNNLLELLQAGPESLTGIMNRRIRDQARESNAINRDEYIIMFPPELVSSLGLSNNAGTTGEQKPAMTEREFYERVVGISADAAFDFELEAAAEAYDNYINLQASNNNLSAAVKQLAENIDAANAIGKSTLAQSMAEGGATPFGREAFVREPNTDVYVSDRVQVSNQFRTLTFPQGTMLEKIIEEAVILSNYGKEAATNIQADADGMINWFRVHTQTFLVPDEEVRSATGENPKIFVYAVVPYKVHSSIFSNATQPAVGIQQRMSQAAKSYDYIYTGQNDDIIDFEINFNNSFFKALSSNINGSGDSRLATRNSTNNPSHPLYGPSQGNQGTNSTTGSQTVSEVSQPAQTGQGGGSESNSPAVQVARMFNEAIVNNEVDLVTMDLTVLGDPYYLADSGQGNYNSPAIARSYTQDGTMDYQRSEVEVLVNFRTPIDYNLNTGGMIFPQDTVPVKAFSGLYKVNTVRNNFSGGKFTQVLSLIRRPNQDSDTGTRGTPNNTRAVENVQQDNTSSTDTNNPPPASAGAGDEAEAQRIANIRAARAQGANTGF